MPPLPRFHRARLARPLAALLLLGGLAGCASLDRDANAEAIAAPAGLKRMLIRTDPFWLTTFARLSDPARPVTVYIEGDGLAWQSRSEPSRDPTPAEAQGLALAAADPGANVVYLARPCQFTARARNPSCTPAYWTGRRFAPEVIGSIGQALDQIAAQAPGQKLHLVGYSGGGAVAVLAAARRQDVASLRTVAGNLDPAEVSRLHQVSPLDGSLDPLAAAGAVARIPQLHFNSATDRVIPPAIAERFVAATGPACARAVTVPGPSHDRGWTERWRGLLATEPVCR
ncbi:alpha/beta hydrolase [Phaeospirillum tilakii]|uniref:Alpha/beta hydrolase n=1 Tax=Phaeospirillum tilakii TaxID=741673 RepID=A0ABW5C8K6_9PROT